MVIDRRESKLYSYERVLITQSFNINNGFGYVTIWDIEEKLAFGPPLLVGFTGRVNEIAFSSDDALIAAASSDGTVRMWDMDPDNIFDLPTVFDDHGDWVWDVDFNPSSTGIMTASADGLIRFFETKPDNMIDQM